METAKYNAASNNWLEHIRQDSSISPADLWCRAIKRGHGATLRPRLATRWWWWRYNDSRGILLYFI